MVILSQFRLPVIACFIHSKELALLQYVVCVVYGTNNWNKFLTLGTSAARSSQRQRGVKPILAFVTSHNI